ncbi:hypothetical protein BDR04DRAFT_1119900 [Suillus decipiens]|nr:hypothetical protein BDR04DRAFT_1119900 [Suillus decipiens]
MPTALRAQYGQTMHFSYHGGFQQQLEAEHIRNDLLQRQAHEALLQQQQQLQQQQRIQQQQEAERLHREAQNDLAAFYVLQQQAAQGHNIQQQLAEMIARHAENACHEQQQEAKWRNRLHQGPQNFDEPPHDYVPNPVPPRNDMAHVPAQEALHQQQIQQQLHQQEARRINREAERVINREAEEALHQQQQQARQQQMQQQMQQ